MTTGPFDVSRFTWKTSGAFSETAALAGALAGSSLPHPASASRMRTQIAKPTSCIVHSVWHAERSRAWQTTTSSRGSTTAIGTRTSTAWPFRSSSRSGCRGSRRRTRARRLLGHRLPGGTALVARLRGHRHRPLRGDGPLRPRECAGRGVSCRRRHRLPGGPVRSTAQSRPSTA